MRGKAWMVVAALVLAAVAVTAGIWIRDTAAATTTTPGVVDSNGRLEIRQVRVSAATGGRVLRLLVREGEPVRAGDTLAVLDGRRQESAVSALRAGVAAAEEGVAGAERRALALESQLSLARLEAGRYRRLFERDAVSRQAADRAEAMLDQLENEYAAARAAIALAREQAGLSRAQLDGGLVELGETLVTAPIDGVVSEIPLRQGELAAPGVPIVVLRRVRDVVLRVYLPLSDAERVQPGAPARIRVDAFPDAMFEGAVERVASEAEFTPRDIHMPDERTTLVYEVLVRVHDPEGLLKDGFPADAQIRLNGDGQRPGERPW